MFTLYCNTIYGLSINFFDTQKECVDFVKKTNPIAHKVVETENQLPMHFFPVFYWNDEKQEPDINIPSAIELKKEELRSIRKPLLEKLDILFVRALEFGNEEEKAKIVKYKNDLRNITLGFFPSDPYLLIYFYPNILNEIALFIQDQF
jgi:hypothetical protein